MLALKSTAYLKCNLKREGGKFYWPTIDESMAVAHMKEYNQCHSYSSCTSNIAMRYRPVVLVDTALGKRAFDVQHHHQQKIFASFCGGGVAWWPLNSQPVEQVFFFFIWTASRTSHIFNCVCLQLGEVAFLIDFLTFVEHGFFNIVSPWGLLLDFWPFGGSGRFPPACPVSCVAEGCIWCSAPVADARDAGARREFVFGIMWCQIHRKSKHNEPFSFAGVPLTTCIRPKCM